jgi:hypothetical protein
MRLRSIAFASPLVFVVASVASVASAQTPTAPPPDPPSPAAVAAPAPSPRAAPPPARATGAQDPDAPVPPPEEDRSVYLSISPFHLLVPFFELTGEVRVHRNVGVAGIVGYGVVRPEGSSAKLDIWEVGGQFVGYPVGHFDHGMQLGLEVLYAGVSGGDASTNNVKVAATASGLAAGPFVGYKLATHVGFTFNVQGGVEYTFVRADASTTTGQTASAQQTRLIPLVNANLGWSF